MADISDDKAALAYLLKQVLLADADAPIALALKQAGVQTASGLMSLEVLQDMPLTYDHPAGGLDKAKKNIPLLPAEMCQIRGLKELHSLSHDECHQQVLRVPRRLGKTYREELCEFSGEHSSHSTTQCDTFCPGPGH